MWSPSVLLPWAGCQGQVLFHLSPPRSASCEVHLGDHIQMDGGILQRKCNKHSGVMLPGVRRWPLWGGKASRATQICPSQVPCQLTLQSSEPGVSQGSPAKTPGLRKAGSSDLDCQRFLCKLQHSFIPKQNCKSRLTSIKHRDHQPKERKV